MTSYMYIKIGLQVNFIALRSLKCRVSDLLLVYHNRSRTLYSSCPFVATNDVGLIQKRINTVSKISLSQQRFKIVDSFSELSHNHFLHERKLKVVKIAILTLIKNCLLLFFAALLVFFPKCSIQ